MKRIVALTTALLFTPFLHAQPARLTPFFDSFNNPVPVDSPFGRKLDRTPPHKRITPFGDAILRTCGRLGDPVSRESVQQLFEDPQWDWALIPVKEKLFPGLDRATFAQRLTHIWSAANAFRHIFCGEPGSKKMRGLHYRDRFAQLYSDGVAGMLPYDQGADEVVPGLIYGIPMQHRWNGRWVRTPIKSYPYSLDARQIIFHATAAALRIGPKQGKGVCRYRVEQQNGASFEAIVVVKGEGLLTFYPDATPPRDVKPC